MSSNNAVTTTKDEMKTVAKTLEMMKDQFAAALPSHISPERMARVAMTAIQNTPKLLQCDRSSFYLSILRAAQLGLEPDGILGQAYLLPYGSQVQLIVGYKGLIDLARRSGEVSNIIAKEVCKNDEFTVDFSLEIPFVHKPKLEGDRGPVTHFWALAKFKDGGFHWDYMSLAEVNEIRDNSQGYKAAVSWSKNSSNKKTKGTVISPWEQNHVEMGKKTVIRRIAKFLPMSVQRAAAADALAEAGKQFDVNSFGDIVLGQDDSVIDGTPISGEASTDKLGQFAGDTNTKADPETGEITSGTDPVTPAATFDINAYKVATQAGTKDAITAFCKILETLPQEERASVFLISGGRDLVSMASRHGMGNLKEKFTDLGINIPAAE